MNMGCHLDTPTQNIGRGLPVNPELVSEMVIRQNVGLADCGLKDRFINNDLAPFDPLRLQSPCPAPKAPVLGPAPQVQTSAQQVPPQSDHAHVPCQHVEERRRQHTQQQMSTLPPLCFDGPPVDGQPAFKRSRTIPSGLRQQHQQQQLQQQQAMFTPMEVNVAAAPLDPVGPRLVPDIRIQPSPTTHQRDETPQGGHSTTQRKRSRSFNLPNPPLPSSPPTPRVNHTPPMRQSRPNTMLRRGTARNHIIRAAFFPRREA